MELVLADATAAPFGFVVSGRLPTKGAAGGLREIAIPPVCPSETAAAIEQVVDAATEAEIQRRFAGGTAGNVGNVGEIACFLAFDRPPEIERCNQGRMAVRAKMPRKAVLRAVGLSCPVRPNAETAVRLLAR